MAAAAGSVAGMGPLLRMGEAELRAAIGEAQVGGGRDRPPAWLVRACVCVCVRVRVRVRQVAPAANPPHERTGPRRRKGLLHR